MTFDCKIKTYSRCEKGGFGALMHTELLDIEQAARDNASSGTLTVSFAHNYRLQFGVQLNYDADANRKYLSRMPETITVTALICYGKHADYAGLDSCIMCAVHTGETIWKGWGNVLSADLIEGNGYHPDKNTAIPVYGSS